jgi:glycosyltransferase involved in cell wall biosynthesis
MEHPKVSVIMSVYNGEKYLQEAVDSILNQTFTDFEFIIINDGSKDKTKEILESYSDPRIRLFHQKNIGLTKSLNRGLKHATGEYIARMDADDISMKNRFKKQVDFLNKNSNIGLIGTWASLIDNDGKNFHNWTLPLEHNSILDRLSESNSFMHGSVMFRKHCVDVVGGYRQEFKYCQDYDLWIRIIEKYNAANIGEFLYKLRRANNSISREKISHQLYFHILTQELAKERKKHGFDSLNEIDIPNIESELTTRYKISKIKINTLKSDRYLYLFSESFNSGDFIFSIRSWLKAFSLSPKLYSVKFLLKTIKIYFQNDAH